ncbi:MAG TPA: bifunctional nuclease domain-containing protein [Geobacteraceae bacterium]
MSSDINQLPVAATRLAMRITGFALESASQRPIAILKDDGGETTFPIWLQASEVATISAELIGRELAGQDGRRDLLAALLTTIGLRLTSLYLDGDPADGYEGRALFSGSEREVVVLLRPCELLAASLKYGLPLLVSPTTVERAAYVDLQNNELRGAADQLFNTDFLESLDPAAMGKYPM